MAASRNGCFSCPNCQGTGQVIVDMVCYGGPPIEVFGNCETCEGEGHPPYEEIRQHILEMASQIVLP